MRYENNISEVKEENYSIHYRYSEIKSWSDREQFHWHEELEIMCYVSGESRMYCNQEVYVPEPRRIFVVNPYELHDLCSVDGCVRHLLLIGKKMLKELGCENICFGHCIDDTEIAKLFDRMYEENERNDEYSKSAMMALATEILVRLCREWSVSEDEQTIDESEAKHRLAASIIEYIDRHFTEQIGVGSICAEFGYSKSYICRAFREVTGLTIAHQIAARRIYYAEALLASKRYSVSECAQMSGFTSASYFSKVYRKMFGRAPSNNRDEDGTPQDVASR